MISSTSGPSPATISVALARSPPLERLAGQLELHPQGDELLLGAVVEVALDLLAGAVGGPDESLARGRDVGERGRPGRRRGAGVRGRRARRRRPRRGSRGGRGSPRRRPARPAGPTPPRLRAGRRAGGAGGAGTTPAAGVEPGRRGGAVPGRRGVVELHPRFLQRPRQESAAARPDRWSRRGRWSAGRARPPSRRATGPGRRGSRAPSPGRSAARPGPRLRARCLAALGASQGDVDDRRGEAQDGGAEHRHQGAPLVVARRAAGGRRGRGRRRGRRRSRSTSRIGLIRSARGPRFGAGRKKFRGSRRCSP